MSRLDSFIRRMSAQRDILNDLASKIDGTAGSVLEFGLGSGRTYDHLRELFPNRRIVVFESDAKTPLERVLEEDVMFGDVRDTSSDLADGCAALIHIDIETGFADRDAGLVTWLPDLAARLLVAGGYVASSSPLPDARLTPCALPEGIEEERYHVLRRV